MRKRRTSVLALPFTVYALIFIVANLVVDVLYTYLNPKIEM
mgnify:CR=1 FL=1